MKRLLIATALVAFATPTLAGNVLENTAEGVLDAAVGIGNAPIAAVLAPTKTSNPVCGVLNILPAAMGTIARAGNAMGDALTGQGNGEVDNVLVYPKVCG